VDETFAPDDIDDDVDLVDITCAKRTELKLIKR